MKELLDWLIGPDGGAWIVITFVVSWALEGWGTWDNLPSKAKSLIILVLAIVLGLFANLLSMHPEVVAAIEPYSKVVMTILTLWLSTQTAHRVDVLRKKSK